MILGAVMNLIDLPIYQIPVVWLLIGLRFVAVFLPKGKFLKEKFLGLSFHLLNLGKVESVVLYLIF